MVTEPEAPAGSARRLRFATYNVHGCVGLDGRHDGERVRRVVLDLAADVVALQEVDSRAGEADPWSEIAHDTDYEVIEGPTLHGHRGRYGNALLTRFPAREVRSVDLSVAGREPRGAVVAEILVPRGAPLWVIATHLGLRHAERDVQVARLADAIDALPSRGDVVLLGDMNVWRPLRDGLGPLRERLAPGPALRTFPTQLPLLALDRVWTRPAQLVERAHVHRSPTSRMASDHLPLVATLARPL